MAQSTIDRLHDYLARLKQSVMAAENGHLIWGLRLGLWHWLSTAFPDDIALRYDALAYLTIRSVKGRWSMDEVIAEPEGEFRNLVRNFPDDFLQRFRRTLLGNEASKQALIQWRAKLRQLHWDCETIAASSGVMMAVVGVTAHVQYPELQPYRSDSHSAVLGVIDVEDEERLLRIDEFIGEYDPYAFDYEYFVCYAASVSRDGSESVSQRRRFWLNWIDVLIPLVLRPHKQLQSSLEKWRP